MAATFIFTGTATVLQNIPSFMENFVQPWKTLSATLGLGVLSKGWNLDTCSAPHEARMYSVEVAFSDPFVNPPVVHAGLTGFDLDKDCSSRLSLKIAQITGCGFVANICTWGDTRVYSVEFSWLAIGG